MTIRFRIFPIVLVACIGLLVVRTLDFVSRDKAISEMLFIPTISAQEENEAAEGDEETGEEETAGNDEEGEQNSEAAEGGGEDGEESDENTAETIKKLKGEPEFTETEVEILRRLAQRRKKLEQQEETLKVKDNVLTITQTKIEQKLIELRDLKQEVEGLLAQYNEKEDAKLRSLVKIYENMKPKDAARIFEDLDISVLLLVIDKMKEAKSALILAKMNPERAKELTIMFAEQRRLSVPTE